MWKTRSGLSAGHTANAQWMCMGAQAGLTLKISVTPCCLTKSMLDLFPSESCRALISMKSITCCCVKMQHIATVSPAQHTQCLQHGFVLHECLVPGSSVFQLQQGWEHSGEKWPWKKRTWKKQVPVLHLTSICTHLQCPVPGNTGMNWELVAQKKWVRRKELSPGLSLPSCNDTDIQARGINFLLEILSARLPVPTRRWTWCACLLRASCSSFHRPPFTESAFSIFFPSHQKEKLSTKKKKFHYFPNSRNLTLAWLLITMSNTLNEHPRRV